MSGKAHILFVGGGTAGHIAPLFPVMEACIAQAQVLGKDLRCSYAGMAEDVASPLIQESELPFTAYVITAGKLNRFLTLRHIPEGVKMIRGIFQARKLLKKLRPTAVFAKGGFVSIPVVMAAKRFGIPVYCHETDVVPGLANRIIAKSATKIFTAFPVEFYKNLPKDRLIATGQPVREDFYAEYDESLPITVEHREISGELPIVTVIGGSQGARRVNELVSEAWSEILPYCELVHITGKHDFIQCVRKADKLPSGLSARLHLAPFIAEELPEVIVRSCLVISRAGGTIFELAAARSPAILLPLSTASQNHQWENAKVLQQKWAAIVLDEKATTAKTLAHEVLHILHTAKERNALSKAIGQFDHPDAAETMARSMLSV